MKTAFRRIASALALSGAAFATHAAIVADVQVVNRTTGEQLTTYRHKGQLWVAGKPGDRYAVQVINKSPGRLLSVVSVDGVNVVSGETAVTSQRGYVLSPRSSVDIAGWRKSDRDVAAFYFTSIDDSYAGKTGRPENVGIIGIAAFREYQEPVPAPAQELSSNEARAPLRSRDAASAPSAAKAESNLSTGHGERVYAPVQQVEFRRASSTPDEIITIRYDSHANLVARGIIPSPRRYPTPSAFPGSYVPDPS
jgi:hypothetical protein